MTGDGHTFRLRSTLAHIAFARLAQPSYRSTHAHMSVGRSAPFLQAPYSTIRPAHTCHPRLSLSARHTGLDVTRLGYTGLDSTRLDSTRLDSTRLDSTRLGSIRLGWIGLGWAGLYWTGLDWTGLDWI